MTIPITILDPLTVSSPFSTMSDERRIARRHRRAPRPRADESATYLPFPFDFDPEYSAPHDPSAPDALSFIRPVRTRPICVGIQNEPVHYGFQSPPFPPLSEQREVRGGAESQFPYKVLAQEGRYPPYWDETPSDPAPIPDNIGFSSPPFPSSEEGDSEDTNDSDDEAVTLPSGEEDSEDANGSDDEAVSIARDRFLTFSFLPYALPPLEWNENIPADLLEDLGRSSGSDVSVIVGRLTQGSFLDLPFPDINGDIVGDKKAKKRLPPYIPPEGERVFLGMHVHTTAFQLDLRRGPAVADPATVAINPRHSIYHNHRIYPDYNTVYKGASVSQPCDGAPKPHSQPGGGSCGPDTPGAPFYLSGTSVDEKVWFESHSTHPGGSPYGLDIPRAPPLPSVAGADEGVCFGSHSTHPAGGPCGSDIPSAPLCPSGTSPDEGIWFGNHPAHPGAMVNFNHPGPPGWRSQEDTPASPPQMRGSASSGDSDDERLGPGPAGWRSDDENSNASDTDNGDGRTAGGGGASGNVATTLTETAAARIAEPNLKDTLAVPIVVASPKAPRRTATFRTPLEDIFIIPRDSGPARTRGLQMVDDIGGSSALTAEKAVAVEPSIYGNTKREATSIASAGDGAPNPKTSFRSLNRGGMITGSTNKETPRSDSQTIPIRSTANFASAKYEEISSPSTPPQLHSKTARLPQELPYIPAAVIPIYDRTLNPEPPQGVLDAQAKMLPATWRIEKWTVAKCRVTAPDPARGEGDGDQSRPEMGSHKATPAPGW